MLSLEDKVGLLTGEQLWTLRAEPRLGLPALVTANGTAAVNPPHDPPAAPLPCAAALGATWDPELLGLAGRWLGEQARRDGVHILLAPAVNLHRFARAGRNFEALSADPLLTSRLAVEFVRGVQSQGVAACVKHFVCNESETDRYTCDVVVDEVALRERYLRPFEAVVREAGVWTLMAAYNGVNGRPMTENGDLLREVLKDEWGFDGVVVSDWGAARSAEECALAGLDLVMPGPDGPWGADLVAAVRAGKVDEKVIDDKVARLRRLARRVGGVEPVKVDPPHRLLAARSFVLLANRSGLLPLAAGEPGEIAVIGEPATSPCLVGGGSASIGAWPAVTPAMALAERADVRVCLGTAVRDAPGHFVRGVVSGGFEVEVCDDQGRVLMSDVRPVPRFNWDRLPADAAEVVIRFEPVLTEPGVHRLSALGLGRFRMAVDGVQAADETLMTDLFRLIAEFRPAPHLCIEVEGRRSRPPGIEVRHAVTGGWPAKFGLGHAPPRLPDPDAEIAAAIAAAERARVAIVFAGTCAEHESEGRDRETLALPGRQDELISAVAAVNTRTVVVLNAGGPVLMPWRDEVAAVLWTWFGGQEYGPAVADVLFGEAEPGGRLPCPLPAEDGPPFPEPVDGRLDYAVPGVSEVAYPFGHGLGYTTWDYHDLRLKAAPDDGVTARVRLSNTGTRTGREVVQCYALDEDGRQALAGFTVAELAPDESRDVSVEVPGSALRRWRPGEGWVMPSGERRLAVGRSAADLRLATRLPEEDRP